MKNWSIKFKVFAVLLLLIVLMVSTMAWLMNRSFDKNFVRYRQSVEEKFNHNLVNALQHYYSRNQSWQALQSDPRRWNEMLHRSTLESGDPMALSPAAPVASQGHPNNPGHFPPGRLPPPQHMASMALPVALYDEDKKFIIGAQMPEEIEVKYLDLIFEGQITGYLAVKKINNINSELDRRFALGMRGMIIRMAVIMLVASIIITFPIARYFTNRIKSLNQATRQVAAGDFSVRLDNSQRDELGQLAQNFNHLAKSLESSSQMQKTMMADIAHELRTPVAVVLGEIEAIQDGVHPANETTFKLLHSQISSLKNLINDLHSLSESDLGSLKYKMRKTDLIPLLQQSKESFETKFRQKNIKLSLSVPESPCFINGDRNRLHQLLNNLLNNSYDYTDENGQCMIKLSIISDKYKLEIMDSSPGLTSPQLTKIFDRWYRVDESRNKNTGGSGLGLAICKEIVKAHNGEIFARSSDFGGVNIIMEFAKL